MKDILLEAFKNHAEGEIRKHVANIEVFLNHPVGVAEHPDTIDTIVRGGLDYCNQANLLIIF